MSVPFGVGLQAAVTMDHKLIRKTNDIETFYERGDESQPIADTKSGTSWVRRQMIVSVTYQMLIRGSRYLRRRIRATTAEGTRLFIEKVDT